MCENMTDLNRCTLTLDKMKVHFWNVQEWHFWNCPSFNPLTTGPNIYQSGVCGELYYKF